MRRILFSVLLLAANVAAAPGNFQLPAFPQPALASEDGAPAEISPIRLLRELHRAGLSGFDRLETVDAEYVLFRGEAVDTLTTWLETVCGAIEFDLRRARAGTYDGAVFARLLEVGVTLGALQGRHRALAMPVGILLCRRAAAWGALPADGANDAYVIVATDSGMMVYDPPTRQVISLADFPNKSAIVEIRF